MHLPRPSWSRVGGALATLLLATPLLVPPAALATQAPDKSETVHVQTDASGTVSEVRVEEQLPNDAKAQQLPDLSTLEDIKATGDEHTYVACPNGTLTWNASGDSVSYQGISHSQPPVTLDVTYTLDGVERKPSELAGASGHLVMRFDYRNNSSQTKSIGGKERRIYTPFVCVTVATLDPKVFSNVQVTNGRLMEDKGGLAVMGFAAPGLKESLGSSLDTLDLDLPEYLELEADVTELALDPTLTIVTPELFGELDTSSFDTLDVGEGTDALRDAMGEIVSGSGSLSSALSQLASGTTQLGGGANALKAALGMLPDGLRQLSTGAQTLQARLGEASGVAQSMARGASGVAASAEAANGLGGDAAAQVSEAQDAVWALKEAADGLDLDRAKTALAAATQSAKEAGETLVALRQLFEQMRQDAKAKSEKDVQGIATVQEDLDALEALLASEELGLTEEQQAALGEQLSLAQEHLETARTEIEKPLEEPAEIATKMQALDEAQKKLLDAGTQIEGSSKDLSLVTGNAEVALSELDGAQASIGDLRRRLGSVEAGTSGLSVGAQGLAEGLGAAATGAASLGEGLDALATKAPQAIEGATALAQGIEALGSGLAATAQGADALTGGLSTMSDEGIDKIADALDELKGDLDGTVDTLDALRDAANDYDNFAGKLEGQSGQVRFIYKTQRIG